MAKPIEVKGVESLPVWVEWIEVIVSGSSK